MEQIPTLSARNRVVTRTPLCGHATEEMPCHAMAWQSHAMRVLYFPRWTTFKKEELLLNRVLPMFRLTD